ncbi:MAG: 16S rRNA (adenine(1518)-N(6)/adenine(1519)-N(6))-dimethyltransferase RsmA [Desulfobacterales bacterium]
MTSPLFLTKKFDLRAKKQLGQNFLSDPSTAKMIVDRSGIDQNDIILEIGAGFGALTIPAAQAARKIFTVEKDLRIIPVLENELSSHKIDNAVILSTDILKLDIAALAQAEDCRFVVLGNLPYNISSQILIRLMAARNVIKRAVLMFQKEMAQRIGASPSCKDYSRISVMTQYLADVKPVAQIKAHLFSPRPKVDSEVIEIVFKNKKQVLAENEDFFFRVIKAGFGKRRKNLKNALSGSELKISAETAILALEQSGINPVRRAETLSVAEFVTLSNELFAIQREISA